MLGSLSYDVRGALIGVLVGSLTRFVVLVMSFSLVVEYSTLRDLML